MPAGPPVVRHAAPDEAAMVAAFGARLFRQTYGPTHPEPELSRYLARRFAPAAIAAALARPGECILLAEVGDAVAGYAWLRETAPGQAASGVAGRHPVEVASFYVDAPWHGRGVAQALMAASAAEAARRGADVLWLAAWQRADRAVAFYRRQGFRVVGTTLFHFGDRADDDFVLARPITAADPG